jgi:uncharacterized protein YutE (UPF0331/DUF86 family)
MAPDAEIVRDRLNRVRRYVTELTEFAKIEEADFLANVERQYAVLHALQLSIEACIEVAMHICSADGLGVAASYAEAFDALERAGILDAPLAADARAMARFRNRIVPFYWDVSLKEVYRILQERVLDFTRFVAAIERYLTAT